MFPAGNHFTCIYSDISFTNICCNRAIEQTSTYNGSSSKVSCEQAISVKMTDESFAYIHFFTVNFSGSQGEIRRPSAEKLSLYVLQQPAFIRLSMLVLIHSYKFKISERFSQIEQSTSP
jgi:hypothetical protein